MLRNARESVKRGRFNLPTCRVPLHIAITSRLILRYWRGCGKTIHEITRNGTKLFVLVRVISWIVLL
jgi:hypothetical protein